MSEHIFAALDAYFSAPGFVCPFARASRKVFFRDTDLDEKSVEKWSAVVLANDVSIVVAAELERTFDEAGAWCRNLASKLSALTSGELRDAEDASPFIQAAPHIDVSYFTIGLGPQYRKDHPRWAPHLCLVSVNEEAIRSVPPDVRAKASQDIVRRVGLVYDAASLWLPNQLQAKRQ